MIAFFVAVSSALVISIIWVKLIDHMKEKHPDYKGEDFLNENEE